MIGVLFLLSLSFILLLYRYRSNVKQYEDIEKLPGPSIWDMIKFYRQNSSDGLITFLQSFNKKYGPTVKIWIKPFKPIIITTDMEFVEKVFKSNEFTYVPSTIELKPMLRDGIGSSKSRVTWRNDKEIIKKTLTYNYTLDRLKSYSKKYDDFIKMVNENLEKIIDVEPVLNRILAEVTVESLNDPQIKINLQEIDEYIQSRNKYMDILLQKMNSKNMVGLLQKFIKTYQPILEPAKKIIQISEKFVKRHEDIPRHQREKINLVYALMDSGMPRDRVVDNINSVITGGYETSVLPLCLTLYELGKRPDLQQKILEEVVSVIGSQQQTKLITLNDLNNMTYLNCVIKEAVRLFFPAPLVDRLLVKDVKIKNMTIPKNTQVFFHLTEILTSEENYQSPNVFSPDRFLPENIDKKAKKAFLPFGFGVKSCPGKHLAMATMKLFVAKIIREFQISSVGDGHKVQLKAHLVFRSIDGIPVIFKKRNHLL